MSERRIAIFGAGYVGLVTAACFAKLGHRVAVREIDPVKVELLRSGRVPIHEPGLDTLLDDHRDRLSFTLDVAEALDGAEVVYICVDTPPAASGDADLSRVWSVLKVLDGAVHVRAVVTKSTVPVGTGTRIRAFLDEAGLAHVGYAANPEFTAEGKAIRDFLEPDRIVVGASDQATSDLIAELHAGIDGPVVRMDVASAEMVKLASNAFLATRISFINEIANVCDLVGADVEKVAEAVGLDQRLGSRYLKPGLGYGGSCFPKDSLALKTIASNSGYNFQLLNAVIEVNELQKRRAVQRLKDTLGTLRGAQIALLGLTFKPNTDDMREAPSTVLAGRLLAEGAQVRTWDPLAKLADAEPWNATTRHDSPLEAMAGADAAIVVTDWPELTNVAWAEARERMRRPVLFDGRNMLDPATMIGLGFTYLAIGRGELGGFVQANQP
jgi:UDPglucose 6-dehydrogenase